MKKFSLSVLLVIAIAISFSAGLAAQPSQSCSIRFRLYDKHGKQFDYNRFCKEVVYLSAGYRTDGTPCTNKYIDRRHFYDKQTGYFHCGEQVVYGDFQCIIIYGKDSMHLMIKNTGLGATIEIDSLAIRKGTYLIGYGRYPTVDFKKASVDYYNDALAYYLGSLKHSGRDTDYFKTRPEAREMQRLKTAFKISRQDNEVKTELPGYYDYFSVAGKVIDKDSASIPFPYVIVLGKPRKADEVNFTKGEFIVDLEKEFEKNDKVTIHIEALGYHPADITIRRKQLPIEKQLLIRLEKKNMELTSPPLKMAQ